MNDFRKFLGLIATMALVMIMALVLVFTGALDHPAMATDNQSHTNSYRVSERGFGIDIADTTFDIPAFRDSSLVPLDSLMFYYGRHTMVDSADTVEFVNFRMPNFKTGFTPVLQSLFVVGAVVADTQFIAMPTNISTDGIYLQIQYKTASTIGMINRPGTVVHWGVVGQRSR